MGAPMLATLLRAGFEARGFDTRPSSEFGVLSTHVSNDVTAFASGLRTLITVVRDIPQTEDVLFGAQGFANIDTLKQIIICSTLSPRYVLDLRERIPPTVSLIDAPISGAQIAAQEARLSFMLGGTNADLDAAQPLFNAMGAHFHRMGPYGSGMQAKVLNNLLAASNTAMTRLVLEWAQNSDLDEGKLLQLIHTSSGQNWFASNFDQIEFARDGYSTENTIGILEKDVESALDGVPEELDRSLPLAVRDAIRNLTEKR